MARPGCDQAVMVAYGSVSPFPQLILDALESQHSQELRKERILTEMYKTGRLGGLYFGKTSRSKENPIKMYINSCLYRHRITFDADLVDDCYQEAFMHLWAMSPAKVCDLFDTSPKKLQATTLMIISLKCFAIDPRYSNPRHSLIQGILFASSFSGAMWIDSSEEFMEMEGSVYEGDWNSKKILTDEPDLCHFTEEYGFSPEDILEVMTAEQREIFYSILGKQPRGKQSTARKQAREQLHQDINQLKSVIHAKG